MRLHSLEITAFGPFADTVCIDFDELGTDGLFLLHGQTGAGKTSILDAVAFALYGTVPGARADGRRLLSDHAPRGAVPKVRLDATIGGRRVRIERSPEFERPKLRGTGTVRQQAKATLEWLDGSGENLSRIPDIGDVVKALLGMSADQFFQVVLLPQGEFAKFLRAPSDERGRLLERLFDTTRFGDVEQWFKERRSTGAKELADAQHAVDVLAAKVAASAGIEAGADSEPVQWAHRLLADAADTRDATAAALDRARDDDTRARAALEAATALQERIGRRAAALATNAELDATAVDRAALAAEREAARRAEVVAVHDRDAAAAAAAAESARRRLDVAATALGAHTEGSALLDEVSGPPSESDRATIRPRCDAWSGRVSRLDALLDEERTLDAIEKRRKRTDVERARLEAEREGVVADRASLPDRLAAATAAVSEAEKAEAALPGLIADRERSADALEAGVELRSRTDELERVRVQAVELHDAANTARTATLEIRERRLAGMAAELAGRLEDGRPCEVCGSRDHPEPARPAPDATTEDDEKRAQTVEQRAAEALSVARAAEAEIAAVVATLEQRCGGREVTDLEETHRLAVAAHEAAADVAGDLPRRRRHVADLTDLDGALQNRAATIDTELAALDRDDAVAEAEATEIRRRITEVAGDGVSVAEQRARTATLLDAATSWLDARIDTAHALALERRRADEAEIAAREHGFADVSEARAAVRTAARLDEIDGVLREAESRRAVAAATLTEPAVAALTGDEFVDVDAARAAVMETGEQLQRAISVASEADRRHDDIATYTARLEDAHATLVPLRDAHAELTALADVVAGGGANARRMSLRSYVLAARLEEVAEAASTRLRRMSGGRYEFVHTDAAGSHGRRGGLGLDIHDEYTGAVRSTKTLSGGESFQASLALALGLADVVAAEAGGIVLDTMFIDEGFGTLDADALDSVMGVLDDLRAGGRVVGVVSHVDEMRQRIPSRLHVLRGRAGSTVDVVG